MSAEAATCVQAVVLRASPLIQAHFRRRGAFTELHVPAEISSPINVVVPRERAAELLLDAQIQLLIAKGSERKAMMHFVWQLERVLRTPAYIQRERLQQAEEAATARAKAWLNEIKATAIGKYCVEVWRFDTDRYVEELRRCGSIGGHAIPASKRREMATALDRLQEVHTEERMGWRSGTILAEADAVIERTRRRAPRAA